MRLRRVGANAASLCRCENTVVLRFFVLCGALLLFVAAEAAAQSAYVVGSIVADVTRLSGSRGTFGGGQEGGEALGGSLRAGAIVSERWGMDLEFARTGEVDVSPRTPILTTQDLVPVVGGVSFFSTSQVSARQRLTTLASSLWVRQPLGNVVDLVFLGGVAFTRVTQDVHFEFRRGPLPIGVILPPMPVSFDTESVEYSAGPIAGLEAEISMTDHLRLVAGARLLVVNASGRSGWVTRPSVGLAWVF